MEHKFVILQVCFIVVHCYVLFEILSEISYEENVSSDRPMSRSDNKALTHVKQYFNSWTIAPYVNVIVYPVQRLNNYFLEMQCRCPPGENERMRHEWIRVQSFSTYPADGRTSILRLAAAGFYYTGSNVRCFSCGLELGVCSIIYPFAVHRDRSPNCSFVRGSSDNVPIAEEGSEPDHSSSTAGTLNSVLPFRGHGLSPDCEDHPENFAVNEIAETSTNNDSSSMWSTENHGATSQVQEWALPVQCSNDVLHSGQTIVYPLHPAYVHAMDRIRSFPVSAGCTAHDPRDLSEAGFFYVGDGDFVICFYCGGGLRNWGRNDHPWEEHARWFPKCGFLQQTKGGEFIRRIQESEIPTESTIKPEDDLYARSAKGSEQLSVAVQSVLEMGYTQRAIDTAITQLRTNTHVRSAKESEQLSVAVQSVLEMGYTHRAVDAAITELRTNTHELRDVTAENILHLLLDMEDSGADMTAPSDPLVPMHTRSASIHTGIRSLEQENVELTNRLLCKVCLDQSVSVTFLPCGHMVCCGQCAPAMRTCPVCRVAIKGTMGAITQTWISACIPPILDHWNKKMWS